MKNNKRQSTPFEVFKEDFVEEYGQPQFDENHDIWEVRPSHIQDMKLDDFDGRSLNKKK